MHSSAEERDKRSFADRRNQPTPLISKYTFWGGRRRDVRREEDRENHIFVDVYSTRLLIASLILVVLSVIDAYFTLSLLHVNLAVEANPLMASYLELGSGSFILMKLFITAVSLVIFCLSKNLRITRIGLPSAIIIYLCVIIYELNLVYKYLPSF